MSYLLETFVWTTILILFVLILRLPISRLFGTRAAYSLWLLPLLRLAIPPITLPAWVAPSKMVGILPVEAPSAGASAGMSVMTTLLVALWATGATGFLIRRAFGYGSARRCLLLNARVVMTSGNVSVIETCGTETPLAFGIFKKFVALPVGFVASQPSQTVDLVLAHELAHHRRRDLLLNVLVQPLFALHWFNPIAHIAWRAFRTDQEAACDASVLSSDRSIDRAAYAKILASFSNLPAGQSTLPLVCNFTGGNQTIHRLRSLTMSNPSTQRTIAWHISFFGALLAVPLTASVSYAQANTSEFRTNQPSAQPLSIEQPAVRVGQTLHTPPATPAAVPIRTLEVLQEIARKSAAANGSSEGSTRRTLTDEETRVIIERHTALRQRLDTIQKTYGDMVRLPMIEARDQLEVIKDQIVVEDAS